MRVFFLIWGAVFFVVLIIYPVHANNKCYEAKICVHDGKEKCGQDGEGNVRRFLDSCDIKEYNCLKGTEYIKVHKTQCSGLPSIDEQVSKETAKKIKGEEENEDLEAGEGHQDNSGSIESKQVENLNDSTENNVLLNIKEDVDSKSKEKRRNKTITTTTTTTIKPIDRRKASVIHEYWCWRAKYCHVDRKVVCGRDRRLEKKMKFNSECHLYHHNCNFETVIFYYVSSCLSLSNHPLTYDSPEARENFAQFHCYKLKTCTEGGDPVCGFDDTETYLAEFEDMCTLHRVNCQRRGIFTYIDFAICEGQKKFQANEPLQHR